MRCCGHGRLGVVPRRDLAVAGSYFVSLFRAHGDRDFSLDMTTPWTSARSRRSSLAAASLSARAAAAVVALCPQDRWRFRMDLRVLIFSIDVPAGAYSPFLYFKF